MNIHENGTISDQVKTDMIQRHEVVRTSSVKERKAPPKSKEGMRPVLVTKKAEINQVQSTMSLGRFNRLLPEGIARGYVDCCSRSPNRCRGCSERITRVNEIFFRPDENMKEVGADSLRRTRPGGCAAGPGKGENKTNVSVIQPSSEFIESRFPLTKGRGMHGTNVRCIDNSLYRSIRKRMAKLPITNSW